jgi:UDP-N-acetylglucosamine 2-epimerase (non-hydrolysing)
MKKKLTFCIGTRPEAIKLAPLILLAKARGHETEVISTGQHREMLLPILKFFQIKADVDLDVLKPDQALADLTAAILQKISQTIAHKRPDFLFVQGDTTTALASALAAFYEKIPVVHVEAGLRTHDRYSPFPEEMNRTVLATLANFHFAPTEGAKKNLNESGITENVWVTGNTGVDALRIASTLPIPETHAGKSDERKILVTCHRRENQGEPLAAICNALLEIADQFPDVRILFPVHLNPHVQKTVQEKLGTHSRITLLAPLNYPEFSALMKESYILVTDSGGVQEEAPYFKKPVFVMRESTERPEGIEAKVAELIGSDRKKIVEKISKALTDSAYYESFRHSENPYGDGFASEKILQALGL